MWADLVWVLTGADLLCLGIVDFGGVFFLWGGEEERREFLCAKLVATEWPGKCRAGAEPREMSRAFHGFHGFSG